MYEPLIEFGDMLVQGDLVIPQGCGRYLTQEWVLQGRGLPEAREDYNFPGMNLLFGEGMLKDIMIPEVRPPPARKGV